MTDFRTKATSVICALALSGACMPAVALASPVDETTENNVAASSASDARSYAYDKADFYAEAASADDAAGLTRDASGANLADEGITALTVDLNATVSPMSLSSELMYFAQFESGNYDQGFSSGDGYHALGCYQFDHRYGLQNFLVACYNYNPSTYHMLAWLKDATVDIPNATIYDWDAKGLTEVGQRLEDSWHAAYAADPTGFSRLQDGWYYQSYMAPAIDYLNARGLNMDSRRDCVKGLASGVMSLFGSGGWRQFVGGTFYGEEYEGAGLTGDMTDREFVTALCNYIVDHVAEFYPGQPQYHEGWRNRYRAELQVCLGYIGEDEPNDPGDVIDPSEPSEPETPDEPNDPDKTYPHTDVDANGWYIEAYEFVTARGIMNGHDNVFEPDEPITRGQVACVLWNMAGNPRSQSANFSDVNYDEYYGQAIRWARYAGVVNGNTGQNTFEPDRYVTRQELACMMANYAKHVDGKSTWTNCAKLNTRPDAQEVSEWAYYSVAWTIDAGVISGVDVNGVKYVQPKATATRAQMAAICMNYLS